MLQHLGSFFRAGDYQIELDWVAISTSADSFKADREDDCEDNDRGEASVTRLHQPLGRDGSEKGRGVHAVTPPLT